ncbi:transposase [Thioclava sp. BHET1]|nr:transposase [Thioclava sp. BHET1]
MPQAADRFQRVIRHHGTADQSSVLAALTGSWSNGQTQGQINRLKRIRRQVYGRAYLDLLGARVIGTALMTGANYTECESELLWGADSGHLLTLLDR